jgi:hypothetical protein
MNNSNISSANKTPQDKNVLVQEKNQNRKQLNNFSFDSESIEYFLEVALGSEYGDSPNIVTKWNKPQVLVKLLGNPNSSDLNCLNKVIDDFNSISATVMIKIGDINSVDISIYFIPEAKFKDVELNYVPTNYGFFWVFWNPKGEIYNARILISTTETSDFERCHLIREELTQSMGLRIDSQKYSNSIFYAPWTTTQQYDLIDEELIKMMYSTSIEAGFTKEEVLNLFTN